MRSKASALAVLLAALVALRAPAAAAPPRALRGGATAGPRLAQPASMSRLLAQRPPSDPNVQELPSPSDVQPKTDDNRMALDDLIALALANNPALAQAAFQVSAARGGWLQAGLYPNPTIGYIGSEIGNEDKAGQQGGFVGQQFVTGGKLGLSRAVASKDVLVAQRQLDAQRYRVVNDVRMRFYAALIAQQAVELNEEVVRINQRGRAAAQSLLEAQEVGRVDLLQAQVELNSATIMLENARNRHAGAWRALAAVVGIPDLPPTHLAGDIRAEARVLTWEESRARLWSFSPELAAARVRVDRARWALRRASAEPIPNLNVQANVQHDNATSDTFASVQVGVPVPLFDRNQGAIRQASAELRMAQAEAARLELGLQERLAAAFERYANARQQATIYAERILPDARTSLDLMNTAYRGGESYLLLLTAQRTYAQANLAYLSALSALWDSTVEIEGLLLAGSLQARP